MMMIILASAENKKNQQIKSILFCVTV